MKDEIYQTASGKIFKMLELGFPDEGSYRVQYLDEDEDRIMVSKEFMKCRFLGNAHSVQRTMFDMTRSIHLRLNKLAKV